MSKVDDELTRRFHLAERPVGSGDLWEELARRRRRRRTLQRLQAGALAVVVLATTATGFVVLQRAFDDGRRGIGDVPTAVANGEIVFAAGSPDGHVHLYAMQPDGSDRRQITDYGSDDTDPAVSPDGRSSAFVHQIRDVPPVIATVPMDGGPPTWLTDERLFVTSGPSWSTDGSKIAFAAHDRGGQRLFVANADGTGVHAITGADLYWTADAAWSPDGEWIAFTASGVSGDREPSTWDVFVVRPDGSELENVTRTPSTHEDESGPTWSPDGTRIAFARAGTEDQRIVIRRVAGGEETILTSGHIDSSPAWSPDGRWIAFDRAGVDRDPGEHPAHQDVWRVRPDGSGLRRLTTQRGFAPTWRPVPEDAEGSDRATPQPSTSTSPEPEARDVGLGFALCDIRELDGIDWYGDGTSGAAWTGARASGDGRCPPDGEGEYVVAADLDGDGVAEPGGMGFLASCLSCRPYATTDLNGDGVLELVVVEEASGTVSYSIHEVSLPTSERAPGIYNLFVAPPGAPEADVPADEPLRLLVGGDEGYSGGITCEGYPDDPILVYTWLLGEVDANTDLEVHTTRIQLGEDGAFHVLGSESSTAPRDAPPEIPTEPACGVDWHPNA